MAEVFHFENVKLIYKNFEGKAKGLNEEGNRNFSFIVPPNRIAELEEAGLIIKELKKINEEDPTQYYMKVKVKFADVGGPRLILVNGDTQVSLDDKSARVLDFTDIISADLSITKYNWKYGGRSGFNAYLRVIYAKIDPDPITAKYI